MCYWNLVAKRRAEEINRERWGLTCKAGCAYKNIILYDTVLNCDTEDAGFPPYLDSELPTSPDITTDCDITTTFTPLYFGKEACTSDISINFLESVQILSISEGQIMIGENEYLLQINGSGSLTLLPDTYLHAIVITPTVNTTAIIGTGPGLDDILYSTPVLLGEVFTHVVNTQFNNAVTLVFTGNYTAKIYTR